MPCSSCSGCRAVCTTRPIALSPLSQSLLSVGLSRGGFSALYWRSQRNFLQDVYHGDPRRGTSPTEGLEAQGTYGTPSEGSATIIVITAHLNGTGLWAPGASVGQQL